jgi:hypothetical protein
MKLNQLPNFRVEDFPGQQSWIGKLFVQLNPFVQAVNQVFDRNINYSDNVKSIVRTYTQNITAFQQFDFEWPFSDELPAQLCVTSAYKGTTLTPVILLVAWKYDATNKLIQVTRMIEVTDSGIAALSGRYQYTIRVTV